MKLVWYQREDGLWNAACACNATVGGIPYERRTDAEAAHFEITGTERRHRAAHPEAARAEPQLLRSLRVPLKHKVPAWWPPRPGNKLRHYTLHGAGAGRVKRVDALLHVLAVFEDKDGEERVVTAEWFPTKRRWNYAVMSGFDAAAGLIWPDGTDKPNDRSP